MSNHVSMLMNLHDLKSILWKSFHLLGDGVMQLCMSLLGSVCTCWAQIVTLSLKPYILRCQAVIGSTTGLGKEFIAWHSSHKANAYDGYASIQASVPLTHTHIYICIACEGRYEPHRSSVQTTLSRRVSKGNTNCCTGIRQPKHTCLNTKGYIQEMQGTH